MLLLHGCHLSESPSRNTSAQAAVQPELSATRLPLVAIDYRLSIDSLYSEYRPPSFFLRLNRHEQKLRLAISMNVVIIPITLYHQNFIDFLCVEIMIFSKIILRLFQGHFVCIKKEDFHKDIFTFLAQWAQTTIRV